MGDGEKESRHIMAKAIFTSEEIEKLAVQQAPARFAMALAPFPGLAKHFLMSDGPRYRRYGNGLYQQSENLFAKSRHKTPLPERKMEPVSTDC